MVFAFGIRTLVKPLRSTSGPISLRRLTHNKVTTLDKAIQAVQSGQSIMSGGFGLCGSPFTFLNEMAKREDLQNLTFISNNGGAPGWGIDLLVANHQVSKMVMSYIGKRKETSIQFMNGQLDIEIVPQGTLAERARAAGAGIGAFYTRTGADTWVEEGRMPVRHNKDGQVIITSEPRETRVIDGRKYVLEYPLHADIALIHATKADKAGNLYFGGSTMNFNAVFAKAAKVTLVEADEIVEIGELSPNEVHVPGIYVDHVIQSTAEKGIEVLRTAEGSGDSGNIDPTRTIIAKRAALELANGSYCNLGIGMPTLIPNYLPPGVEVILESENGILGLGPYPKTVQDADPDVVNAGKESATMKVGAAAFGSEESFGMIRAGKLDASVLGAIEVSQYGDLANWTLPDRVFGTGGAMDLVSNPEGTRIIVMTTHTDTKGNPKIVKKCVNPLTGSRCVSLIVTELAVFEVNWEKGLTLVDIQPGSSLEEIKAKTGAPFEVQLRDRPTA